MNTDYIDFTCNSLEYIHRISCNPRWRDCPPHTKDYMVEHSTFKQEMPTYTSIKVKDVTKSKLDVLQSKFTINTGKKISLQNLLDKISDYALLHEDELIKKMPALRDDPAWSEAMDWGEETDASRVDEYLYQ